MATSYINNELVSYTPNDPIQLTNSAVRMTTAEKNSIPAPFEGMLVFDTDLNKLCVYTTVWETVVSA